ncbi:hypothetical protein [Flavobacterium subsaxonicum]|uniref:Uncharacterized protein n=1 Tax=Flavobacterium subsaxonicum WB 4.1-42 = DSM 21790 TaxID=1121898 RepID=A0A0A2MJI3_9FLAO|nr:hypothetical protein [Flavobacterium subsaxonicum]KGO91628.1 hypothetical protein Q766_16485 [Flavobacterium subsaxonicum WB 4.1-42 = DSM 21790]
MEGIRSAKSKVAGRAKLIKNIFQKQFVIELDLTKISKRMFLNPSKKQSRGALGTTALQKIKN